MVVDALLFIACPVESSAVVVLAAHPRDWPVDTTARFIGNAPALRVLAISSTCL